MQGCNAHALQTALRILCGPGPAQMWAGSYAAQCSFDTADVEAERAVIAEEWRQGLGARQRSQAALFGALFGCTRHLQRHPIGELAVVDSASPDTLRRFYRRWHPPIRAPVPVANERTNEEAGEAGGLAGGRLC
jgi:predicted Zn-dependent peptidase